MAIDSWHYEMLSDCNKFLLDTSNTSSDSTPLFHGHALSGMLGISGPAGAADLDLGNLGLFCSPALHCACFILTALKADFTPDF